MKLVSEVGECLSKVNPCKKSWSLVIPEDKWISEEDFKEKCSNNLKYAVAKKEKSDAGFIHYHMLLVFKNPIHFSTISNMFKLCSIQIVKNLEALLHYILKDETSKEEPLMIGEVPALTIAKVINKSVNLTACLKAALECKSYEEAVGKVEELNLGEYVKNRKAIQSYLSTKFLPKLKVQPQENFIKDAPLITFRGRQQALLLVGPSGVGKTQYALSQFQKPLVVTCKQDFGLYSCAHDGIVIDDLPWASHAPETLVRLLNSEIPQTIDIKYGSVTLPIGIKKIFTLNSEMQFWPKALFTQDGEKNSQLSDVYDAIRSRIKIITVNNSLFNPNISYV